MKGRDLLELGGGENFNVQVSGNNVLFTLKDGKSGISAGSEYTFSVWMSGEDQPGPAFYGDVPYPFNITAFLTNNNTEISNTRRVYKVKGEGNVEIVSTPESSYNIGLLALATLSISQIILRHKKHNSKDN